MTKRSGVILAGGRSTRFAGADKALVEIAGTPMVRRVADRLGTVVDEVIVNCRTEQREAVRAAIDGCSTPTRIALDDHPDEGPVAGMYSGLAAADGDLVAVLACDMPAVVPSFVDALFSVATGDRRLDSPSVPAAGPTPPDDSPPYDAVVPISPEGWYEPLQAVYRRAWDRDTSWAAAIAETKRAFIDGHHGERLRAPRFWAPFVHYGRDPGPESAERRRTD